MVWLHISLAFPSGEEGGILPVQIISTCLRFAQRKGWGGVSTLWIYLSIEPAKWGEPIQEIQAHSDHLKGEN
jgi:hypothetical protein